MSVSIESPRKAKKMEINLLRKTNIMNGINNDSRDQVNHGMSLIKTLKSTAFKSLMIEYEASSIAHIDLLRPPRK